MAFASLRRWLGLEQHPPAAASGSNPTAAAASSSRPAFTVVTVQSPYLLMYKAAESGNYTSAQAALAVDRRVLTDHINEAKDKALHLAVRMGHVDFVRRLLAEIGNMSCLCLTDGYGYTPLGYAALSGRADLVRLLLENNRATLTTANNDATYPMVLAAKHRKEDVLTVLLEHAEVADFNLPTWLEFLICLVEANLYGHAGQLLDKFEPAVLLREVDDEHRTVLHVVAKQKTHSDSWAGFVDRVWNTMASFEDAELHRLLGEPTSPPIVLVAAKSGSMRVIKTVIEHVPSLLLSEDANGLNLFRLAITYRSFELLQYWNKLGCLIEVIATKKDNDGNNMLHHAAKRARTYWSPGELIDLSTLLQLQLDMDWFEVMREVFPACCQVATNVDGITPRQLFNREHESMLRDSKEWLAKTSQTCLVVAAIMMPIGYAAMTLPIQITDESMKRDIHFMVPSFVSATALSFFSVVGFWFLGIWGHQSRYQNLRTSVIGIFLPTMFYLCLSIVIVLIQTLSILGKMYLWKNTNLKVSITWDWVILGLSTLLIISPLIRYMIRSLCIKRKIRWILRN